MYRSNPLKSIPKMAVKDAALKAIQDVETAFPGTVEIHAEEICEIFSRTVENRSREIPEERRAAGQKFLEDLQKAAREKLRAMETPSAS